MRSLAEKIQWAGRLVAVQPRIRLTRSFDERSHTYQGYVLRVQGTLGKVSGEFLVAVGPTTHAKHRFRVGDEVQGIGHPVVDPRLETAEIYKVSGLKVLMRTPPPISKIGPMHPTAACSRKPSVRPQERSTLNTNVSRSVLRCNPQRSHDEGSASRRTRLPMPTPAGRSAGPHCLPDSRICAAIHTPVTSGRTALPAHSRRGVCAAGRLR